MREEPPTLRGGSPGGSEILGLHALHSIPNTNKWRTPPSYCHEVPLQMRLSSNLTPANSFSRIAERLCSGPPPLPLSPYRGFLRRPLSPDSLGTKLPPRCYITGPGEGHITMNPFQGNWRSRSGVLFRGISVPLEVRILSLLFHLTLHLCTGDDVDPSGWPFTPSISLGLSSLGCSSIYPLAHAASKLRHSRLDLGPWARAVGSGRGTGVRCLEGGSRPGLSAIRLSTVQQEAGHTMPNLLMYVRLMHLLPR